MLELDIKTKLIPPDHRVFVLHPGEKKRFYGSFADQSVVFLDLPGADLPLDPDPNRPEVRAEIYKSRAIANWHRTGADKAKKPDRNVGSYIARAAAKNNSRYMTEIETLYKEAKPGDLVISPGPGYSSPVYIGELVGSYKPGVVGHAARMYGNEPIPARRVKWLPPQQIKRQFSERLIKLMQNRQALIEVKILIEREEIYDLVYKDYAWGTAAVGRTLVKDQAFDLRNVGTGTKIIYYIAAMYLAEDAGALNAFALLDIDAAIQTFYVEDTFTDTAIEIHSPGTIWLHTKKLTLPAFLSAMLALSAPGTTASAAAAAHITNSLATPGAPDPCVIDVENRVRNASNAQGRKLWEKLCHERAAELARLQLESTIALKQAPNRKKK